jgi:hypothetical protein
MANKKRSKAKKKAHRNSESSLRDILSVYSSLADLKHRIDSFSEIGAKTGERLSDLEAHVNLLTRLLTALCIEKMGMRLGALRRLVKRIETEAIRDSQIMELESLYNLSHGTHKKHASSPARSKEDPWDKIS